MVSLRNVTRTNDILRTEYFPEGNETDIGEIEYDLKNNKPISIQYCKADEDSNLKGYSKRAISAIKEIAKLKQIPKTYDYMWY